MIGANRRRWLGPALAVTALAAGATVFRTFLFNTVFEPMAWFLWAGWRVMASVDRGICWGIVIIVCFVIVFRLVVAHARTEAQDHRVRERDELPGDRLSHWQAAATHAARPGDGVESFRASVEALALSVAEATKSRPPSLPAKRQLPGTAMWIDRLLPGRRKRMDLRAIDELLTWMEAALEVKHERNTE
jgi:uncharacterized membrane protein